MYTIFCQMVGLHTGLWILLCTTSNQCTQFSVKWLGYVQGMDVIVLQAMYRIF